MFITWKAIRRWKREENEETAHNLFKSSAAATKSAISTDTVSGAARTGRISCQLRINTDSGKCFLVVVLLKHETKAFINREELNFVKLALVDAYAGSRILSQGTRHRQRTKDNQYSDYSRSSAYGSQEFPSKLFGEKHFLQKRKDHRSKFEEFLLRKPNNGLKLTKQSRWLFWWTLLHRYARFHQKHVFGYVFIYTWQINPTRWTQVTECQPMAR